MNGIQSENFTVVPIVPEPNSVLEIIEKLESTDRHVLTNYDTTGPRQK